MIDLQLVTQSKLIDPDKLIKEYDCGRCGLAQAHPENSNPTSIDLAYCEELACSGMFLQ
jgi:hypothetical protein